ncbi:hypothetical protein ACET3Z_010907 [Daucus carota]
MSDSYSPKRKNLKDVSEKPSPTKREVHSTRRETSQFRNSTRDAEAARAKTESELFEAKKTVKDLASRIEESNSRVKKIEELEKQTKSRELGQDQRCNRREDDRYVEIIKELDYIKQEIRKLKADMAFVLDQKRDAEKETEASSSKIKSYSGSVEVLRKEIDELNEEHVLVELARMEANKEYKEIEAKRKEDAKQHSSVLEGTRKKVSDLNDLFEEINSAEELQNKLADTTYDVDTLKNELALVMSKDTKKSEGLEYAGKGEESESPSFLQLVLEELEAAKKELALINEEGFQFTASMDIIRDEVKHLSEEIARLKKTEEKADLTVQSLNSKLLRANLKLEAVCAAVKEANSMSTSLEVALEQIKTEAEAAKREKELISEDTAKMKAEVPKIESEIDILQAKLEAAIQELGSVKSSEATALENLKAIVENLMRSRASASRQSATITISTFEFEYLKGRAAGAEELADKKVAAAHAWIEALKASEKEILMKTEIAHRELREERNALETEEPVLTKVSDNEVQIQGRKVDKFIEPNKMQLEVPPRKSVNKYGTLTPSRRSRVRTSASPANRNMSKSNSSSLDRKRKGVPTLAKFLSSNNNERNQ